MDRYCKKCDTTKNVSQFSKDSSRVDGYSYTCKDCRKSYHKSYRTKNAKKISSKKDVWYSQNKEHKNPKFIEKKMCGICKKTRTSSKFHKSSKKQDGLENTCKDCKKIQNQQYYQNNKSEIKKKNRAWESQNKDKASKSKQNWKKRNPEYLREYSQRLQVRLANNLRTRLRKAIQNHQKVGSAVSDLGCSIDFLKSYLESKFQLGMSWKNYGEWQIDHVKPLSSFDLADRKQLLEACNYSNLQPLWKEDNLSKGSEALAA